MPHSSGGGSHGGGGHGGHGGSSTRVSSRPFKGASRYVYYNLKTRTPVVTYANYDVTKSGASAQIVLVIMVVAMCFMCLLGIIAGGLHFPKKLNTNYDTKIIIKDEANIISDEEEKYLLSALRKFYNKTGITPAVITVNNETWKKEYRDLEKYAYDRYLEEFDDEKHWLIIYSEPVDKDPGFNDWYWEGMQGNNTDSILTTNETNKFNKRLQKNLLKADKFTPAEAIEDAFNSFSSHVMDQYVDFKLMIASAVLSVFFILPLAGLLIFAIKKNKMYKYAFKCPESVVMQAKCSYCGGTYIVGHHTHCPYCQAQFPYDPAVADTQQT